MNSQYDFLPSFYKTHLGSRLYRNRKLMIIFAIGFVGATILMLIALAAINSAYWYMAFLLLLPSVVLTLFIFLQNISIKSRKLFLSECPLEFFFYQGYFIFQFAGRPAYSKKLKSFAPVTGRPGVPDVFQISGITSITMSADERFIIVRGSIFQLYNNGQYEQIAALAIPRAYTGEKQMIQYMNSYVLASGYNLQ